MFAPRGTEPGKTLDGGKGANDSANARTSGQPYPVILGIDEPFPVPAPTIVNPGSSSFDSSIYPTDVTQMTVQGLKKVMIPLGAQNSIQRRSTTNLGGFEFDKPLLGGAMTPSAVAGRSQGDFMFTANFTDGSISPLDATSGDLRQFSSPVSIGPNVDRLAIQLQNSATNSLSIAILPLRDAPRTAFDQGAHQDALVATLRGLESTVSESQASPNAIDGQVESAVRRIEDWVVDPGLKGAVTSTLTEVAILYRQEYEQQH
jgi:hypothetical protein